MSESELVRYRRDGCVARLTLNRPERLNATTLETLPDLCGAAAFGMRTARVAPCGRIGVAGAGVARVRRTCAIRR